MKLTSNSIEKSFMPFLLILFLMGMETWPWKNVVSKSSETMWRSGIIRRLFQSLLFLISVFQTLLVTISLGRKAMISSYIYLILQIIKYIAVYKSRKNLVLLLKKSTKISRILNLTGKDKMIVIFVFTFCILTASFVVFWGTSVFNHVEVGKFHPNFVSNYYIFKEYNDMYILLRTCSNIIYIVVFQGIFSFMAAFYCIYCCHIKTIFTEYRLKTKKLIPNADYTKILGVYQDFFEIISLADSVFSCPMFIEVVTDMIQFFWYFVRLLDQTPLDLAAEVSLSLGLVQCLLLLSMVLLSAAFLNEEVSYGRDVIKSLPLFYPDSEKQLNIYIGQHFTEKADLTLWKIYRIDKSSLITVLGTLISYAVLFGTLGGLHNSC